VKRRTFIAGLGAAAAWPLAARGQQVAVPVVGYLAAASAAQYTPHLVPAFRQGLSEAGYTDGRNVAIEYRWADGQYDRLPALTIDLVSRRVNVIFAASNAAVLAAKPAAIGTPIVFSIGADPVKLGLVASMNRPGGNITGVSFLSTAIMAKSLEVLHEAVPNVAVVGALINPTNPDAESNTREAQEAAAVLGLELHVLNASTKREIDSAIATLVERHAGALLVEGDSFFFDQKDQVIALAARHSIPAISSVSEWVYGGGLMSYSASIAEAHRIAGGYVGRVLRGEKPADLPVQQMTKIELVVNLKTARALGIAMPLPLLGRADEVIE
jgi:putative ABC transport system substrate-binding protein